MPLQPVYSQLFLAAHALVPGSGVISSAAVPEGFTGVLRALTFCPNASAGSGALFYVVYPGSILVNIWTVFTSELPSPYASAAWEGRVVMPAGSYVEAQVNQGEADLTANGYILTGVSPLS